MTNIKAFTLIEMLISLIVAAILVLTTGVLSDMATSTSTRLRKEAEIYNEILNGYKLMQKYIREASSCAMITPGTGTWIGNIIECPAAAGVTGVAFGVWNDSGNRQFVFLPDKLDNTVRRILFEVRADSAFPNNIMTLTGVTTPGYLDVTLQGSKGVASRTNNVDEIPFQLNTKVNYR